MHHLYNNVFQLVLDHRWTRDPSVIHILHRCIQFESFQQMNLFLIQLNLIHNLRMMANQNLNYTFPDWLNHSKSKAYDIEQKKGRFTADKLKQQYITYVKYRFGREGLVFLTYLHLL